MAKKRQRASRAPRPTWDFGRKVKRLLDDRRAEGAEPSTAAALARVIDPPLDPGTAIDWIQLGRSPRSTTGRKVAAVLGVDPGWLLDDAQSWPPPKAATGIDVILRQIPEAQRGPLERILRDPVERASWIAAWEARHPGRS